MIDKELFDEVVRIARQAIRYSKTAAEDIRERDKFLCQMQGVETLTRQLDDAVAKTEAQAPAEKSVDAMVAELYGDGVLMKAKQVLVTGPIETCIVGIVVTDIGRKRELTFERVGNNKEWTLLTDVAVEHEVRW